MCLNCLQFLVFVCVCVCDLWGSAASPIPVSVPCLLKRCSGGRINIVLSNLWVKFIGTTYSWVEEIPP